MTVSILSNNIFPSIKGKLVAATLLVCTGEDSVKVGEDNMFYIGEDSVKVETCLSPSSLHKN